MKKCSKCKEEKDLLEFSKNKCQKDGYTGWCKNCVKEYQEENKDRMAKQRKIYNDSHKEEIKKHYEENKVRITKRHKKYYEENKEAILKKCKKYKEENKEHIKKYYKDNKKEIIEKKKKYFKKRYNSDIEFKITSNLRRRVLLALKGKNKSKRTMELLDCSIKFLRKHLESQFKSGMTWDNQGFKGWHIDHIKPCAKFDLMKPEEQQKCFHYTNLQPLWAEENMKKGSQYE